MNEPATHLTHETGESTLSRSTGSTYGPHAQGTAQEENKCHEEVCGEGPLPG